MIAISVVIPIYNAQRFLTKCLDSILEQTLKNIEIICVDDGSTDESLGILEYYAKRDSRIKILSQQNQNAGIARNAGLELASGEFVFFMDSDDYLTADNILEKLYSIATSVNSPIIKFKAQAFDDLTGKYISNIVYEAKKINPEYWNKYLTVQFNLDILLQLCVTPWAGLYNRKFLMKTGVRFNANKCCNDRAFNIISILEAGGVYLASIVVVNHRKSSKSLITIRDRHFECHFNSINIIQNYLETTSYDSLIKRKVLIRELRDIYLFYHKFSEKSSFFHQIYCKTIKFAQNFNIDKLLPEVQEEDFYYLFKNLKRSNYALAFITYYLKIFYNKFLYKPITILILLYILYRNRSKKILFWGASLWLEEILTKFKFVRNYKNIAGVIDKSPEKQQSDFCNLQVFNLDNFENINSALIILTVKNNSRFIYDKLHEFLKENYENVNLAYNIFETEFIELCQKK